ncbi:hypothetical protein PQE74_gp101 [Bacillus phage vB_BanS_Chewbecca]|uniref:WDGH domain-containing protein n=1 Tax=Bacillus phage vB_BanS_Chewbecca TaxID=2894786 RepID=A0AAE8YMR6_9CAUD|nr:hypothetical protein PQE74_gp101 [Bacillus phage vB_BanS_Chewbecca]UGO46184.1 hypothetical protein CHEWBECCA_101 [Bacillus phage vB_BanS_Chewbecca]
MSQFKLGNKVIFKSEVPEIHKITETMVGFNGRESVSLDKAHKSISADLVMRVGEFSDGYHTFDELYYHRMMLFLVICHTYKEQAWKSMLHSDGTMFDGSFIVGVTTPEGQYSYHYREQDFDLFKVKELDFAPEYDGHVPSDITRLLSLLGE